MNKTTKIISIVLVVTVAVTCVIAGALTVKKNTDRKPTENGNEVVNTTATEPPVTTSTEPVTTTQAPLPTLAELLIGKWTDSAGMSGYEFFADGRVSITYVNLEGFNIPFEGKADNGAYTLSGDKLKISYSIYTATIDKTYTIAIANDTLTMRDIEDGNVSTYRRGQATGTTAATATVASGTAAANTTAASVQSAPEELYGSWVNSDSSVKYTFGSDGELKIVQNGKKYAGVYIAEGDTVTLQYSGDNGSRITEKYIYSVSTNSMRLSSGNETKVFVRKGSSIDFGTEDDLIGVWLDSAGNKAYEFKPDCIVTVYGSGTYTGGYEVDDGELSILYYVAGTLTTQHFEYTLSGNTLTLEGEADGKTYTYTKQ